MVDKENLEVRQWMVSTAAEPRYTPGQLMAKAVLELGVLDHVARREYWRAWERWDVVQRRDGTVYAGEDHPRQLFLLHEEEYDRLHRVYIVHSAEEVA